MNEKKRIAIIEPLATVRCNQGSKCNFNELINLLFTNFSRYTNIPKKRQQQNMKLTFAKSNVHVMYLMLFEVSLKPVIGHVNASRYHCTQANDSNGD